MNESIVVGVDGSAGARTALTWALDESGRTGASVQVVHAWQAPMIVSPVGIPGRPWDDTEVKLHARNVVEDAIKTAEAAYGRDTGQVSSLAVEGHVAAVLLDAARGADLLVVGSRGLGGFRGLLLGSVSQRCLHHAPCPVVVVPSTWEPRAESRPVVVGVDGSEGSARALEVALDMARARQTTLVVVQAWSMPVVSGLYPVVADEEEQNALTARARQSAREMVARLVTDSDVCVQVVGVQGAAATTLLRYAEAADALVVGSRGHGGVAGILLGSVSQQCAHHSPCPVVVVPPT